MPTDNVTIDPEFLPIERPRPRGVGWVAIVGALLAVGLLLSLPAADTQSGLTVVAATTPVATTSPQASSVAPIQSVTTGVPPGQAMPGFTDTITTITWRREGVDILRWRSWQPEPELELSLDHTGGSNRILDASGSWLAEIRRQSVLEIRAVDGADSHQERTVAASGSDVVWSAVWHDTRPGMLAWLACPANASSTLATLRTVDVATPDTAPAATPLKGFPCDEPGVWLARWGDWGLLLNSSDGSGKQVLVDTTGKETARGLLGRDGEWFVGVGPELETVWTEGPGRADASSFLVSLDGGDRLAVPGLARGERLESALISPDGSLLALVPDVDANFGSAVRIVAVGTGSLVAEIAEPSAWVDRVVWSSDSRFLVYERWPDIDSNWAGVPQSVELVLYDTETNSGVALPLPPYAAVLRSSAPI